MYLIIPITGTFDLIVIIINPPMHYIILSNYNLLLDYFPIL